MDPRMSQPRPMLRPIAPQVPYFVHYPIYPHPPPPSAYTAYVSHPPITYAAPPPRVAFAPTQPITIPSATRPNYYPHTTAGMKSTRITERPAKQSRALQIIDPKTGKDVIRCYTQEKVGSLDKDAEEFKPGNHSADISSTKQDKDLKNQKIQDTNNQTSTTQSIPEPNEKLLDKKNEEKDLACSIMQIPKNLERLADKSLDTKQGIVSRKPPYGSIPSRRGHACSPPFQSHNLRTKKTNSNNPKSNQSDSNNNVIKTSSPIQKIDSDTAGLLQEDVSSPIMSQTIEGGSLDDDFLSSTAKDEIFEIEKSSKRHIYFKKKLIELQSSPLVLKFPPPLGSKLLDRNMDENTYRILFDKNLINYDDSFELSNSSYKFGNMSKKSFNDFRSNDSYNSRINKTPEKKGIIRVTLSQPNVTLNESENAWKPSHLKPTVRLSANEEKLERLNKNFRSLLNKITAENFIHLSKEARNPQKYPIDTMEALESIVNILFEKSISEPGFASIYAHLCKSLSDAHIFQPIEKDMNENEVKKIQNPWKMSLISRCQIEFERYARDEETLIEILDKISKAEDEAEKEEYQDLHFLYRHRAQGTIKFIGELYMFDMLNSNIMLRCIDSLLSCITEENITRVCHLLTTIGKKLEENLTIEHVQKNKKLSEVIECKSGKKIIDGYMKKLESLKEASCITTSRVKFEIMNLMDLRKANWIPRVNAKSNEAKPKTLDELKEESKRELMKKQEMLNNYRPSRDMLSSHNSNSRHNQRMKQQSFQQHKNSHTKLNGFDFSKIKTIHSTEDQILLGPQKGLYNRGNSLPVQQSMSINNQYANLKLDLDDQELLPSYHHVRSNLSKNNKKDKNNTNQQIQMQIENKPLIKSESSCSLNNDTSSQTDYDDFDNIFYIELTDDEDKILNSFVNKLNALINGKLTMDMMISDVKDLKITDKILAMIYNTYLDKKENERIEFIDTFIDLLKENLIDKHINIEALDLLIKLVPSLICDVPLVCKYIAFFLTKLYDAQMISLKEIGKLKVDEMSKPILECLKESKINIDDAETVESQIKINTEELKHDEDEKPLIASTSSKKQNESSPSTSNQKLCRTNSKGKSKDNSKNSKKPIRESSITVLPEISQTEVQYSPKLSYKDVVSSKKVNTSAQFSLANTSNEVINDSHQSEPESPESPVEESVSKCKIHAEKVNFMKKIIFYLKKKMPLENSYELIDKNNLAKSPTFVHELTTTIIKNYSIIKKNKNSGDCFLLLRRYIDVGVKEGIDCLNGIVDTAVPDKIVEFFKLFYDNNVVAVESFKEWKKQSEKDKNKKSIVNQAQSFFVMLDEPDKTDSE